ncbi:MAG: exosortase/archaeosortase family protein [Opitutales bacterium]
MLAFVIWDQSHWGRTRDEYLFGFLVPVFVVWVLNERRGLWRLVFDPASGPPQTEWEHGWQERLRAWRRRTWPAWTARLFECLALMAAMIGFIGIAFAVLYRAMESHNLVTTQLSTLGFALLLLSAAFLFFDRRKNGERLPLGERFLAVSLLLFPALIWVLSAPLFSFLDNSIRTFLMNKVAVVVFEVFDLLGYSITREGSVLVLPTGRVGVAEACSGIYSLMASLFAGSFLAATSLPVGFAALWKKAAMVLAAMLFAFLTNIARSLFLTLWAYHRGPEAIEESVILLGQDLGSLHDFLGYAVIVPVVVALLLLVALFSIRMEEPAPA